MKLHIENYDIPLRITYATLLKYALLPKEGIIPEAFQTLTQLLSDSSSTPTRLAIDLTQSELRMRMIDINKDVATVVLRGHLACFNREGIRHDIVCDPYIVDIDTSLILGLTYTRIDDSKGEVMSRVPHTTQETILNAIDDTNTKQSVKSQFNALVDTLSLNGYGEIYYPKINTYLTIEVDAYATVI